MMKLTAIAEEWFQFAAELSHPKSIIQYRNTISKKIWLKQIPLSEGGPALVGPDVRVFEEANVCES